jgi:glycine/D-amino acid oxidase-like deaminating enzyme
LIGEKNHSILVEQFADVDGDQQANGKVKTVDGKIQHKKLLLCGEYWLRLQRTTGILSIRERWGFRFYRFVISIYAVVIFS